MTKSKLKTGMIVTQRCGNKFMVFENANVYATNDDNKILVEINGSVWSNLRASYNEDMTSAYNSDFDIMKVEKCTSIADLLNIKRQTITIWERKEKKTYTYAQLKEILGEEFEVVG